LGESAFVRREIEFFQWGKKKGPGGKKRKPGWYEIAKKRRSYRYRARDSAQGEKNKMLFVC